ncbi:helix-turn-helix domain-containing protein [Paenibacillus athensensis]|uniref:Transcriptional regulator n=1 Tax=Paenibacillus athensensis TaxID=1967502 RepID=A0A4Y8PW90_9BACL|nr:helix-turn-helix transcriptional regulator [Paenibacillus athensensis]MCD1260601.1 helix-turn-helix domain-containing protein [Paenibacillus athensensis]
MRTELERSKELAHFLQTRRARLTPQQVGLPPGLRRRTPGLRRAEVAQLAGVSVDWYTWLEQGRDIQASPQVLESLVLALRLDENERKHLFLLAYGHLPPESKPVSREVSPLLQTLLDRQGDCPAYVVNTRWDIVAWNEAARRVFGDYAAMTERERNSLWRFFTDPTVRGLLGGHWEENARRRLAQFRASYGGHIGDPWWNTILDELCAASAEFRQWWPEHDVLNVPEGLKELQHPVAGTLVLEHLTFQAVDAPDLQMTINLPHDDVTAERLKRLNQR